MEKLIIIDFGSQYTHLICRRIRELKVKAEIVPWYNADVVLSRDVKGVILSGGPMSVYDENAPKINEDLIQELRINHIPVLGICYGHQLLAHLLGGKVSRGEKKEYGPAELEIISYGRLLRGLNSVEKVWMSHGDRVEILPEGFTVLAKTVNCPIAAYESVDGLIFGVQFHPEVKHTPHGLNILKNFLDICGFKYEWNLEDIISNIIWRIREKVGENRVLMAASGGVDSTTAAFLIHKAIGDRLHLVFMNTGLLREGEDEWVLGMLKSLGFKNIHYVNASKRFLTALRGVSDPEEKRKIFSKIYAEVLEETATELEKQYGEFKFLAQGTIYPDRVESGATSKAADKIKSHHNVIMPRLSKLEILEPLADFYKDEVREIARLLGIPKDVWGRHPFPGPGLLVRILGEITEEKLRIARRAHTIVEEEIKKSGLYDELWQIFPVILDSKAVGVKGDARSYEYIIAIRAVKSEDAMTAEFAKLPWELLERIANRLVNEIEGVGRVVYDITHKPPATIEYE